MGKNKIDINPSMLRFTFPKFKKWFKETIKDSELSAEQWYVKLGGNIPKKKEE